MPAVDAQVTATTVEFSRHWTPFKKHTFPAIKRAITNSLDICFPSNGHTHLFDKRLLSNLHVYIRKLLRRRKCAPFCCRKYLVNSVFF